MVDGTFVSVCVCRRRSSPGQVTEVGVGGSSEDLTADLAELIHAIAEGDDLSGAHKGKVQRIEEQNHVLSFKRGGKMSRVKSERRSQQGS